MGVLSSSWLRDPGDCTGSRRRLISFGDSTSPMLVFCYDFEVAWIFHRQLQRTVF